MYNVAVTVYGERTLTRAYDVARARAPVRRHKDTRSHSQLLHSRWQENIVTRWRENIVT